MIVKASWQTSLLKNRSNRVHTFAGTLGPSGQPVGPNGCVRQETRGMRRHHELCPLSCSDRSQRGKKPRRKERRKRSPRSAKEPHKLSRVLIPRRARCCQFEMRPRTLRLQHRIRTGHALPWIESRTNTVYVNQSVPRRSRRPWRVEEYQPYRRWKFSEWFWWPRNTPKTRRGTQDPHL